MATALLQNLASQGWHRLPASKALKAWAEHHLLPAQQCLHDPKQQSWWCYSNTWFAGVNVLPNNGKGAVDGCPPLPEALLTELLAYCDASQGDMDKGQISALLPGYPQWDPQQSAAANQFRQQHFAAHLDGLVPIGTQRRRHLTEQHSFILGIGLTDHPEEAAPLMLWPGSQQRIQAWLRSRLANLPSERWAEVDLTDEYQQLRQQILMDTQPMPLPLSKGQGYLLHRHLLHGMGHWPHDIPDPQQQGRIIAYFRPCWHAPSLWLHGP